MLAWLKQRPWLWPVGLVLFVLVAYLPSLGGGFIELDDPWLIQNNALLHEGSLAALRRIFLDFSRETRLELGAEYLPVRDLSLLVQLHFWQSPRWLRVAQLAIYAASCLAFRHGLRAALGPSLAAEAAAWAFALHPVHVESVAWLSGHKDVLALFFVGAALATYASKSNRVAWASPVLLALAHFSKSMTITAVGLLVAHDLLAGRKPRSAVLATSVGVALLAAALHFHVGGIVHMVQAPHGGSRLATFGIMGSVWLRYLGLLVWPPGLSLVHDVELGATPTLLGITGWLVLAGWGAGALHFAMKKRSALPLAAWLWFSVPLVPVSQVLVPLQNVMADRYLYLSAMLPALALAGVAAYRPKRRATSTMRAGTVMLALLALTAATSSRATLFGDSVALFREAEGKTTRSAVPSYALGTALESRGDAAGARLAYEEAVRRDDLSESPSEAGRRATNNLARLLVAAGDLQGASDLLGRARTRWPDDPKLLANLVRVRHRMGAHDDARRLFDELARRFPEFRPEAREERPGP